MRELTDVLQRHVDDGSVPGAVALVAAGDRAEVTVVGSADAEGRIPLARDAIFRIASITKPIVAAAAMMLVDDGRLALDDEVRTWLPELAAPSVVRTPSSPVDDVVPAARPVTVEDLLTFRCGWGFPSDFSLPAVAPLFAILAQGPLPPDTTPDAWVAALASIPMLHQPGEAWLYNTGADVLGVLVARLTGRPLSAFLHERVFGPLGMVDTGFFVPAAALGRLVGYYRRAENGDVELVDGGAGAWAQPPVFPSGAGGLVSTADDWWAFGRMLAGRGAVDGRRLLAPESVDRMTTDHLTAAQRAASTLFLEGQGWGFGGSVDVARLDPWNVPGRYGWVGGTGTAGHVVPSTGAVTVLLTQMEMAGPTPPPVMRDFWSCAAR